MVSILILDLGWLNIRIGGWTWMYVGRSKVVGLGWWVDQCLILFIVQHATDQGKMNRISNRMSMKRIPKNITAKVL
jgi:hypothetical protein